MTNPTWSVEFYTTERDRCPAEKFIDSLRDKREHAALMHALELLEEHGTDLRMPHAAYLRDGLWELRGGKHSRLLYISHVGRRFIVLHGFWKATQQTPNREIETALQRRADFLERERTGSD